MKIRIDFLANHQNLIPDLSESFFNEWHHFNPGKTIDDIRNALRLRTNTDKLPLTFVAINENDELVGSVSLKQNDLDTRTDLSPWLSSLFVVEKFRNAGIGNLLINKTLEIAGGLQIHSIFLYTEHKEKYYEKRDWRLIENQAYHENTISIMEYSLQTTRTPNRI